MPSAPPPRPGDFSVVVTFTAAPTGQIYNARITQSSGNPRVDSYALYAVNGAKVPPFTTDMGTDALDVTLPIAIKNSQPVTSPDAE